MPIQFPPPLVFDYALRYEALVDLRLTAWRPKFTEWGLG